MMEQSTEQYWPLSYCDTVQGIALDFEDRPFQYRMPQSRYPRLSDSAGRFREEIRTTERDSLRNAGHWVFGRRKAFDFLQIYNALLSSEGRVCVNQICASFATQKFGSPFVTLIGMFWVFQGLKSKKAFLNPISDSRKYRIVAVWIYNKDRSSIRLDSGRMAFSERTEPGNAGKPRYRFCQTDPDGSGQNPMDPHGTSYLPSRDAGHAKLERPVHGPKDPISPQKG